MVKETEMSGPARRKVKKGWGDGGVGDGRGNGEGVGRDRGHIG